jgi:asparagine synthase (glutamine-hydrolysing)
MVTELVRKEKVKVGSEQDARVACFTIRFPNESGYNESGKGVPSPNMICCTDIYLDVADRTAEWLNVQIVKLDITEQRLADDFADCVYHSEHHHFDLNSVAKFGLSTLPSKLGVKAILTGEGSDEHFSGYLYYLPEYLREADASLPDSELTKDSALREELQKKASFEMGSIWKSQGWKEYEGIPGVNLDALQDLRGNKMPNTLLTARPPDALFPEEIRRKYEGSRDMRETMLASYTPEVREKMREKWHPANTAMYIGNKSSFPNVLLSCLGDRTEMAHSIEARTPFLDHHLTNYVNTLPPSTKLKFTPPNESNQQQGTNFWLESRSALQSFTDKWILREAVRPYITDELYNRRKFPFLAPARWPKDGPLHKMFKELLTPEAVENLGFIDSGLVAKALEDGFSDKANPMSFRTLCYVGSWVVLARKFGIKKACVETSNGV